MSDLLELIIPEDDSIQIILDSICASLDKESLIEQFWI